MPQRHHTLLWLFAFGTFVVGDTVTTAVGLATSAVEANPVGAAVLAEFGKPGMVVLKAGIVLTLYVGYYVFDRRTRYDIDDEAALFVAGLGAAVVVWNLYVIAVVS